MKQKLIIILVLLLVAALGQAQVTIGSDNKPNDGTLLMFNDGTKGADGINAQKGLALPRVRLQNTNSLQMSETPNAELVGKELEHTGLLVYNANTNFDECETTSIPSGMYIWEGTKWKLLGTSKQQIVTSIRPPLTLPNTYMVTTVGSANDITIPVAKAFAVWEYWASEEGGQKLISKPFTGSLSTKIEWQEGGKRGLSNHIVNDPILNTTNLDKNATITVPTTGNVGNAVISLSDNTGIRWSWHIWVTEEPATYTHNTGKQTNIWMDRNLGATSATPADNGTIGLHYQWGRNSPFPTFTAFDSYDNGASVGFITKVKVPSATVGEALTYDGTPPVFGERNRNTLDFAIRNPITLIGHASSDWYSFGKLTGEAPGYYGDNWTERWLEKMEGTDACNNSYSVTSITNPCPDGWKVPAFNDSQVRDLDSPWAKANTVSNKVTKYISGWEPSMFDMDKGYNMTDNAYNLGYFPAAGARNAENGYDYPMYSGTYWSASLPVAYSLTFANLLKFTPMSWNVDIDSYGNYPYRSNAFSVRCVQE